MAIREILVHLDPTPRSAIRLRLATELAMRFNAQVVGLYVTHSRPPGPNEQRSAALMEDEFRRSLSQQGLAGTWQFVQDSPAETIIRFGRYADLSII
jgi:K+-sensing histidine kinase KdpD